VVVYLGAARASEPARDRVFRCAQQRSVHAQGSSRALLASVQWDDDDDEDPNENSDGKSGGVRPPFLYIAL